MVVLQFLEFFGHEVNKVIYIGSHPIGLRKTES